MTEQVKSKKGFKHADTRRSWTTKDIELLEELYAKGLQIKDIAVEMGRTHKSVSGMMHRMRTELKKKENVGYRRDPSRGKSVSVKDRVGPDYKAKANSLWALAMGIKN